MGCCYFVIIFLLVFNPLIYSAKPIKDSLSGKSEKIKIKKDDSPDAIFLSAKTGYFFTFPEYDSNFNRNWAVNLSFGAMFNNNWKAEMNFEYWKSAIENYHIPSSNIYYSRDIKGVGYFLNVIYIYNDPGGLVNLQCGAGIGNYEVHYKNFDGHYDYKKYLLVSLLTGVEFRFFKNISIDCEVSYYRLLTAIENRVPFSVFNIKTGLVFYLYY